MGTGKYVQRAMFVDLEPTVIGEVHSILTTQTTLKHFDWFFMINNEVLYDICQNNVDIESAI